MPPRENVQREGLSFAELQHPPDRHADLLSTLVASLLSDGLQKRGADGVLDIALAFMKGRVSP